MKKLLLLAILGLSACMANAQQYRVSDQESSVQFKIKNLGVTISGSLGGLKGEVNLDPRNLSNARILASVQANTINTGIDMRDDHLRSDEFFDVQKYPLLKFESTQIVASRRADTYRVTGNLTIKDVTRQISFLFRAVQENGKLRLSGSFKINRRDYHVGGSSFTLSDDLTVVLEVVALPQ